ncbi:NACHT domain-containing protein [Flavobacterium sp. 25HG05S-40]|uniref:NACHT domain-containing protein n=1 Tax=Flavobacterium sp. 25HG05S-40 TaxID=3458682 RepID=UPI004044F1FE
MDKKNTIENKIKGDLFEKQVGEIYEGLGYKIESNRIVEGQQVDLIATKTVKGAGQVILMIECKYLTKGSVSNQNVMDFKNFIESNRSIQRISSGVLITNTSFSSTSHLAKGPYLNLLTINELETTLFDIKDSLRTIVSDYERDPMFYDFITLSGSKESDKILDVKEHLLKSIEYEANTTSFVSVLADYGSGKTTLMQRIRYELANKYLLEKTTIKPFYLELKNFHKYSDLQTFISITFCKQFNLDISQEKIWKEIDRGGFVFLLDGFDEMSLQVNNKVKLDNFMILYRILLSNSFSIITCRPSYFVSNKEYNDLIKAIQHKVNPTKIILPSNTSDYIRRKSDFKILETQLSTKYISSKNSHNETNSNKSYMTITLDSFSEEKIDLFLKNFEGKFQEVCNSSWQEVKDFLLSVYDLKDLMKKPILLSMIKDTILLEKGNYKKSNINYGSSALYELYTNLNLELEWSKGTTRQLIDKEQRREFAQAIAILIYKSDKPDIAYNDIIDIIKQYKNNLENINKSISNYAIKDIASDIQICTFITRVGEDKFKFIHRSFMEFFVARFIKDNLDDENILDLISSNKVPKEILYFLGGFGVIEKKTKSMLLNLSKRKLMNDSNFKRNICVAIIFSSLKHDELKINETFIDKIDIKKINFLNTTFQNLTIKEVNWGFQTINLSKFINVKIDNSNFEDTTFEDTTFENCELEKSELINPNGYISLVNSSFNNFQLTSTKKTSLAINGKKIESELKNGKIEIDNLILKGLLEIRHVKFKNCKILINEKTELNEEFIKFSNCQFEDCQLEILLNDINKLNFELCEFSDCQFLGYSLPINFKQVNSIYNSYGFFFSENLFFNIKKNQYAYVANDAILKYDDGIFVVNQNNISKIKINKNILEPFSDLKRENDIIKFKRVTSHFIKKHFPKDQIINELFSNLIFNYSLINLINNYQSFCEKKLMPLENVKEIDLIISKNKLSQNLKFENLFNVEIESTEVIYLINVAVIKNKHLFLWILMFYSSNKNKYTFPRKIFELAEKIVEDAIINLDKIDKEKILTSKEMKIIDRPFTKLLIDIETKLTQVIVKHLKDYLD